MTRFVCKAPTRVDLAGGSFDLWPLGLLVKGAQTLNVAISLTAEAVLERMPLQPMHLQSEDLGAAYSWRPEEAPGTLSLLERYCTTLGVTAGWRLSTKSGSPPGAGLGGSSALSIAVVRVLAAASGARMSDEQLVETCRDVEAQQLGIPTGVQDFWAAVRGGVLRLRYEPGKTTVEPVAVDISTLSSRLVVAYTGQSRISGKANWELFKRVIEREPQAVSALQGLAEAARHMGDALEAGDWDAAGEAMALEMSHREKLAAEIVTPEIAALLTAAQEAGALGGKVCGAGGGGCVAFLAKEGYKEAVRRALSAAGALVLDAVPVSEGARLETVS